MDNRMRLVTLVAAFSLFPATAYAQANDSVAALSASFGLSFAVESISGAVSPSCGSGYGARPKGVVSAFLAIPIWRRIGVETRASGRGAGSSHCGYAFAPLQQLDGIVTDTDPELGSGGFAAIDTRLRVDAPWRSLVATAGAGWAGSLKDVPYLVGSVGTRGRFTAEIEVTSFHVPWTARTTEYQGFEVVREVALRRFKTWETSVAIRIGLQLPVE